MEENIFIFKKLKVYQKSLDLSITIIKLLKPIPYEYQSIRSQLIRAIISISLNIAEGNGRNSSKEKIYFYRIAKGSAFESILLFEIFYQLNIINKDKRKEFRGEIKEITKMISGLIKYHK